MNSVAVLLFIFLIVQGLYTGYCLTLAIKTYRYRKNWWYQMTIIDALIHASVAYKPETFSSQAAYEHWHDKKFADINREQHSREDIHHQFVTYLGMTLLNSVLCSFWWIVFVRMYLEIMY